MKEVGRTRIDIDRYSGTDLTILIQELQDAQEELTALGADRIEFVTETEYGYYDDTWEVYHVVGYRK